MYIIVFFFLTTEGHAWGLNFVSEEEAKKFLEFCSVCIILYIIHVVKINLCMKLQFIEEMSVFFLPNRPNACVLRQLILHQFTLCPITLTKTQVDRPRYRNCK